MENYKYTIGIMLNTSDGLYEIYYKQSKSADEVLCFDKRIENATTYDSILDARDEFNSIMIRLAWWIDINSDKSIVSVNLCELDSCNHVIRRERKL